MLEQEHLNQPNISDTDIKTDPNLTTRRWVFLIVLVIVLGGGWIIFNRTTKLTPSTLKTAPVTGYLAPEIDLISIEGEPLKLSDFKGKPVIINFWATWCGPCRAEMPELQAVHRELGDKIVVYSVNATAQDGGDIAGFIKEFGITFPVMLDKEGQVFDDYDILALPTTIFVDRNGVIKEVFTGAVNKAYIESRLADL